jgi:hypothetical protein
LEDWEKQASTVQQHSFLLIEPFDMKTVQIMDSEYLEWTDDYRVFTNSTVIPETLELMPITLQELMQNVLGYFKKSSEIKYSTGYENYRLWEWGMCSPCMPMFKA